MDKYSTARIKWLRIKNSEINGKGVFANKDFPNNSAVGNFEGYEVEKNTRHSLTFTNQIIEPTGPLKFLNHSCNPNSRFKDRILFTTKDVKKGEELTIDYLVSEMSFTHPFKCKCKLNKECGKIIGK